MAPHVLIVDLDAAAARVTTAWIQRLAPAATVAVAATTEQAWLLATHVPPDVLIIDPAPHQLALGFVRRCKTHWPALRIVVLASSTMPTLRSAAGRLGVQLYAEKPVALTALHAALLAVLTRTNLINGMISTDV